jgi:hypothetical protein
MAFIAKESNLTKQFFKAAVSYRTVSTVEYWPCVRCSYPTELHNRPTLWITVKDSETKFKSVRKSTSLSCKIKKDIRETISFLHDTL